MNLSQLTLAQAATRHGVSPATLRRGLKRGDLEYGEDIHGRYVVDDRDVARFLGPKSRLTDYNDELMNAVRDLAAVYGPVSPEMAGRIAGLLATA